MAFQFTPGSSVTLDETSDLQNATATPTPDTDANDNDIAASFLPTAFSTSLAGAGTSINAALSGYTGAVGITGSNAFTFSLDPNITATGLAFTDSVGAPLDGDDSGLDTVNGDSILLYTDTTNNNILYGKVGSTIVFAAYLEETFTGTALTGAKLWMVQYQAIKHPDSTSPDDSVNLLNKVYVGVEQQQEFSLANAPSGQNLFLMFTTANPTVVDGRVQGVSIIATGKDPANQSTGANITTGDTINTSQAGGPTTFGTNSQMITEQEGIRFTFVTGAKQDYTIPNLDQNEADVEANIDFTAVFGARTATFDVVQLQSGKSAQVRISAFSTAAESGVNFIDGYVGDATRAITNVRVINIATGQVIENSNGSVNDPSIGISFTAEGVATITGVKAGYKIEYTTTLDHNRVLVENGAALTAKGNDHADFDIGAFKLLQVTTDNPEIGSLMNFEDDGPSITVSLAAAADALTVDETDLGTNASADFSDNFTNAPNYGADGAGTVASAYALGVKSAGVDSGLVDVASNEAVLLRVNAGVVEGYTATGNVLVFTVSVSAGGLVSLDQLRALKHPDGTNPDDAVSPNAADLISLTRTDTITDKDGDTSTGFAVINIGQALSFEDDGPSITVSLAAAADALTVDETDLGTNASADFSDNFTNAPSYGADGAGTVASAYALGVKSAGVDSGLVDVASNEAVLLRVNAGVVEGYTATGNVLVFTVSVSAGGLVSLDQLRALKHPDGTSPDDAVSPNAADLISLTRTDTITDKDGDTSTGFATLDIAAALSFKDDGPSISVNAAVQLDDDALTGGNPGGTDDVDPDTANLTGTLGHSFGADGAGSIAYLTSGAPDGFTYETSGSSLLVKQGATTVLTLTLNTTTGDYAVTQNAPIMHAAGLDENNQAFTINYRVTDGDGDTADGTLAIDVDDDTPTVTTSPVKDTEPDLGATQWTYSESFAYSIGADHHGSTYSATNSDFAALSLSGFANDVAIGSPSVTWDSEDDSLATFDLSFNYDHDRNEDTAPQPVEGQLVFDKINDTYTVTLDALQVKQDVTLGQGTGYETYDINGTTPSSGPSNVATGKLGDGFYIQITGFESPLSAGGNTIVSDGELVSGTVAPVTLSSTALGVSGNTIQSGEAANLEFFTTDPKGDLTKNDFAYATDFFIKFDGIETESDDLILVLDLVDASNPANTITRAIYVDQGDIYESDTSNAGLVGTKYQPIIATLDNNDGLLIVESNDFNISVGDNWVLKGMQILSNDAGLTGSAINLNRAVGDSGGSSYSAVPVSGIIGPGNTIAEDTSTNPLKIIDAGFSTTTTIPPTLDLELDFKVVDADGDYTAEQTIDIEYGLPAQQVALVGISSLDLEAVGLA